MGQPVILHLEEVTKQFAAHRAPAVDRVSLELRQGDLLGFLGPSGCGKTTLLRLIAGFERPQGGVIYLGNQLVAGPDSWVPPEQRDVGMVFQDYALFPHLTVADNVGFGLRHSGLREKNSQLQQQIRQRVMEVLTLVSLEGFENRYPHELSGGQQQRVALARALAPKPFLILLDEPLSNLDLQVRVRLRQEIRTILKSTGTSGVFVTHDQEEALSISDWVAVMREGRIEQFGTPETIYHHPATRFVAEFVAQANFLPAQLKERGWETEIGYFPANPAESSEGDRATLMIRQEDLVLSPDKDSAVVIHDRQFLGREHRYCLLTPSGRELHARTTIDINLPTGISVKVTASQSAIRVFHA